MAKTAPHVVAVLRALRDSHHAQTIRVFGSAARGSTVANDVDIAIDLRGLTPPGFDMGARYEALNIKAEIERQYAGILSLARQHYGRLDPFLITDRGLYVRNVHASCWVKAVNARALVQQIETTSVPLSHAMFLYDVKSKASQFQGPLADPAFRRWFAQSKATDARTGAPQVLFHGTGADIGRIFRPGTFFTSLPEIADIYAKGPSRKTDDAGPNICPVFLSVQNPFIFDDALINDNISHHILGKRARLSDVFIKLAADGYDGLFIKNYHDLGGVQNQFVIFKSSQVRTAVGWHCAPHADVVHAQMELLAEHDHTEQTQGCDV